MGFHTFDVDRAERLSDPERYRWCSTEELLTLLCPHENAVVADLGSGTGFYTDDVAREAATVLAVDVQPAMHAHYADRGIPSNVRTVTGEVADLPLADDALDAAFSTMTYHEFSGEAAMAELARVLKPGGRLLTVDWSAQGSAITGPPLAERHDLADAVRAKTDAGFTVDHAVSRTETFVCRARR
jgi:ubiquinone/menaquinone biosynthesis C-methylase UbiE